MGKTKREYTVWFVWDDGSLEEEVLTTDATDATNAIEEIQKSYEPIRIISVMPFDFWQVVKTKFDVK
jgi:hypothetical protein